MDPVATRRAQPTGIELCGVVYYTPEEVGEMFGWTTQTLAHWRTQGEGPKYCKRGSKVFYPDHGLSDWLEESYGSSEPVVKPIASQTLAARRMTKKTEASERWRLDWPEPPPGSRIRRGEPLSRRSAEAWRRKQEAARAALALEPSADGNTDLS